MDILGVLILILRLYMYVLLARVLISWVRVDPYHPAVQLLYQVTEPVLQPLRAVLPQGGGLDFSPLVAVLLLQALIIVLSSSF